MAKPDGASLAGAAESTPGQGREGTEAAGGGQDSVSPPGHTAPLRDVRAGAGAVPKPIVNKAEDRL